MIEQEVDIVVVDNDVIEEIDDTANKTFVNPSQDLSEQMFKCENCEYEAARKSDVLQHKIASHNWCSFCYCSFVTQERLKLHISKRHSNLMKTD